ncbi:MAG: glycoside hydrolase family 25 protein, partial [Polyangiaceae bacterium]
MLVLALGVAACSSPSDSEENVGTSHEELATVCGASSDGPTQGRDVSVYQGAFDWDGQKNDGVDFGYARIGDGLGGDDEFAGNWSRMKAAGVLRGAYQFFEPGEDATAQANLMIDAVGKLGDGDLPCMIDVEVTGGQSGATIASRVKTWLDLVEAGTGKKPMIYTGPYFWADNVGSSDFGDYPLWIADYGPACPLVPPGWTDWTIWQ